MTSEDTKRNYQAAYRRRNRDRINTRQREWAAKHPEKIREYRRKYLQKMTMSGKRNIRASWSDYGLEIVQGYIIRVMK